MPHTLIFDIGKTNKKAILFDENYKEVSKTYVQFDEQRDEDGFPCDDLTAIQNWIQETIKVVFENEKYDVQAINFSTYGASFVHLDKNGKPLTPLYNYLKPIPEKILQSFYAKYGDEQKITCETASPSLGMLNAGLQLYWLKQTQPNVYNKIRWSLHFPQYLSFFLTDVPLSEYTSIGCHTMLWNYSNKDYHDWVYEEGIDRVLPSIVATNTSISKYIVGKNVKVGIGIHDSSAALLPYIKTDKNPFLLISTGTWSISLNPFNKELLTGEELEKDCLNFMQINARPVKAARLFLGEEYKIQVEALQIFYNEGGDAHQQVSFNEEVYQQILSSKRYCFPFKYLKTFWQQPTESQLYQFENFEEAYHQLMWELASLQIESAKLAIGTTNVENVYIDGGFSENEIFIQLIARFFKGVKLWIAQSPIGSALGAALVMSDEKIDQQFLEKNYAMEEYTF